MRVDIITKIKYYLSINKCLTADEIKIKLNEENIKVSKNTIINILNENNFKYKNPINKPLITDKQKENRILWCNKYLNYNWDNVKFTDETSIWIGFKGKRWVNIEENDYEFKVKHPTKIHIWGYISKTFGRKIYMFTDILTADGYLNILKNELGNEQNFILQDDNDPKHRAKIITKWKNENNIKYIDWPSNSPDLNPIENIWSLLKNKVKKITAKNINELKENINKCWNELEEEHIINTINSMSKRIKNVLDNDGKCINY